MSDPVKMTVNEYHTHEEESNGLCLACREFKFGDCEPDAENYTCDECGEDQVMGIELALVSGEIDIIEEG